MIEIKARIGGKVLYTAEGAQDVRAALVEAAKSGADLSGAYLSSSHPLYPIRLDFWDVLDLSTRASAPAWSARSRTFAGSTSAPSGSRRTPTARPRAGSSRSARATSPLTRTRRRRTGSGCRRAHSVPGWRSSGSTSGESREHGSWTHFGKVA